MRKVRNAAKGWKENRNRRRVAHTAVADVPRVLASYVQMATGRESRVAADPYDLSLRLRKPVCICAVFVRISVAVWFQAGKVQVTVKVEVPAVRGHLRHTDDINTEPAERIMTCLTKDAICYSQYSFVIQVEIQRILVVTLVVVALLHTLVEPLAVTPMPGQAVIGP